MNAKAYSLLFLRVSLGVLLLLWGADKLIDVEHGVAVSDSFYLGLFSSAGLLRAFGVVEMAVGVLVVLGLARALAYPAQALINLASLLGVWRSVVDPWGWVLEGTNVLFYPSLIIFAASLAVWAFADQDPLSLDALRRRGRVAPDTAERPPSPSPAQRA